MINDEGASRLLGRIYGEKGPMDLEEGFEYRSYVVRIHLLLAIDEIAFTRKNPVRDRKIIFLRFGLESGKCLTFKEIAAEVDLSLERVRQIITQTLRHLRHPFYSRHYRPRKEKT